MSSDAMGSNDRSDEWDAGRSTGVGGLRGIRRDVEIRRDVRAELEMDQDITNERDVHLSVDYGVVDLVGSTDNFAEKWAIERAAYRVAGVKLVRNQLEVAPPKDDTRSDGDLAGAVNRTLEWDVRVPRGVRADVSSGVVRLHGVVQRSTQRDAAEDAVRHLVGLRGISNEIKVVPAEVAVDLERQIEAALDRRFDGDARSISVAAVEGVVTLRGAVPSFALRDDVERTVRCAPGVTSVDDQLQIG